MPFIIRRGGYGPKTYWAGFKGEDETIGRSKRCLRWSKEQSDAISFLRETDANVVRHGLRMFRLSPRVIAIDDAA